MTLFIVIGSLKAISEERRVEYFLPEPLAYSVSVFALLQTSVNLLIGAGVSLKHSLAACIGLLIYLLFVAVFYFPSLLVPVAEDKQ